MKALNINLHVFYGTLLSNLKRYTHLCSVLKLKVPSRQSAAPHSLSLSWRVSNLLWTLEISHQLKYKAFSARHSGCVLQPRFIVLFTELKKFKHYQIVMTSYNIIGESPPSAPVEVSVGEAGGWKDVLKTSLMWISKSNPSIYKIYSLQHNERSACVNALVNFMIIIITYLFL